MINQMVLLKNIQVKKIVSRNKKIKEWMTAGLLCSTWKKNELSVEMKKHPLNNTLFKYKQSYRNKLNSLRREAK